MSIATNAQLTISLRLEITSPLDEDSRVSEIKTAVRKEAIELINKQLPDAKFVNITIEQLHIGDKK